MSPPSSITTAELSCHVESLRRLARSLVGDDHAADDLVQDAWLRFLSRPPRAVGAIGAWLSKVVRRLALDGHRALSRREAREQQAARPEVDATHTVSLDRLELGRELVDAVLQLPEPYRSVVYLRHWEGLEIAEIAARTHAPLKTVQTRLARGLARLRITLDDRHGGRREAWFAAVLPLAMGRHAVTAVTGAGSVAPGIFMMKKIAAAVLFILVGVLAWRQLASAPGAREAADAPRAASDAPIVSAHPINTAVKPITPLGTAPADPVPAEASAASTRPTASLTVHVKWHDGTAASGIVIDADCYDTAEPRREPVRARTDASGTADLAPLSAGNIFLTADRGHDLRLTLTPGQHREIDFTFPTADDVAGTVVGEDGRPVDGAEVWVGGTFAASVARTNAEGAFRVRAVSTDARLSARAPGHAPSNAFDVAELPVGTAGVRTVTLTLGPAGSAVQGRVHDPDGKPVANAWVKAGPRGDYIIDLPDGRRTTAPTPVAVLTDQDGRFAYPGGFAAGATPIAVMATGWPIWTGTVTVVAGAPSVIDVTLERPATIEGTLVDAAGVPVAGIVVSDSEEHGGGWHFDPFPVAHAKSDRDGKFTLQWIPPGERELNAAAGNQPELGRAQVRITCVAGETTRVTMKFDQGLTISGRVQDLGDHPLAGWGVYGDPQPRGTAYPRQMKSRADGTFILVNLDANYLYDVAVAAPHTIPIPPRAQTKGVKPGARDLLLTVSDTRQPDAHLRGRVADASGLVPKDVKLVYSPVGSDSGLFIEFDATTGAFNEGPILAGRYVLTILRGGMTLFTSAPVEVAPGADVDLGVIGPERPGHLELTFSGIPADAVAALHVTLDRPNHGTVRLKMEAGVFRSPDLEPGTWTVTLYGEPWFLRAADVRLAAGETKRVELPLEPAFESTVDLLLPTSGASWTTATCQVKDEKGTVVWRSGTMLQAAAEDGRIHLYRMSLPKGTFHLEASTDSGLRGEASIGVDGTGARGRVLEVSLR